MTGYIRGMQQVVAYGTSAGRLYAASTDNLGRLQKPDAAPNITIYDIGGTERVAVTAMTEDAYTTEGFLSYDAQTAEFVVGETLTGGTSLATALIVDQVKLGASGRLRLADISGGPFQDNETITDSGSGSATSDGTLFQAKYYYDLDASSSTVYGVGQNYFAKIEYDISTRSFERRLYFDVANLPAVPWVTSSDFAERYPHLAGSVPDEWPDWTPAIKTAHADLVRKLHALGEQAAFFIKREEEMWAVEMLFTRAEVSRATGEPLEDRKDWEEKASAAWGARGEFTYDSDSDPEVDDDVKVVSSAWTR